MSGKCVHCKRERFDVYIGRPSKWGNPFMLGRDGTRDEVIAKYEQWVRRQAGLMQEVIQLHGKVLGCWCAPQRCHGEVLLRLAEEAMREAEDLEALAERIADRLYMSDLLALDEWDKQREWCYGSDELLSPEFPDAEVLQ
jgi:hypothetical protein